MAATAVGFWVTTTRSDGLKHGHMPVGIHQFRFKSEGFFSGQILKFELAWSAIRVLTQPLVKRFQFFRCGCGLTATGWGYRSPLGR